MYRNLLIKTIGIFINKSIKHHLLMVLIILASTSMSIASNDDKHTHATDDTKNILHIVGWDVYSDPIAKNKTIGYKQFEKKYNVTIEFTPLSNLDDIIDATESGTHYDVIIISNEGIHILGKMGLAVPLNLSKIPNHQDLYPSLKINKWIKRERHIMAIPWAWGPTGLLYDTKTVSKPDSWNVLWDKKHQGKISLWDDVSMIWTTALSLGYTNVYNLTRQQLTEVKHKLFKLNNQVYAYYSGGEQAEEYIKHGHAAVLNSWYDPSGRLRKQGSQFKMIIPKEGAVGMFDSYLISSNSLKQKLAYQYLNYQISPLVQKEMFRSTGLIPANKKAKETLSIEEIKSLPKNEEAYYKKMILWNVMPRKHLYDQVLKEVNEDLAQKYKANTELDLSAEEKKWLAENPSITFTGDPNWLPYEAFQKDGSYIGIVAEHLKLITETTGLKFIMSPSQTWTESTEKAKQGLVDVLSETDDSDLRSHLDFTTPYVSHPIVIAMSSKEDYVETITNIKDKKIALIRDYGYASKIRKKYPDIKFVTVENIQDGLSKVSAGVVDALLCTHALCSYTITELGLNDIRIVGKTKFDTKLALGVQKNLRELQSILNKAIAKISHSQQQVIFDKWIKNKYVEKVDYTLVYQIIGAAIILILFFIFWNRRLEHEVQQRTKELTIARDEAQDANASKSEFLSRMSHELRTPMNAILGFSQLLELNSDNHFSKNELEFIGEILTAGYHLLELINEVLDLSQVESGELQLKLENIELSSIVEQCVALIKPLADRSHIKITYPNISDPIYVMADRVRIKQIIINLLANAVKYNNENGHIDIKYKISDSKIKLSVEDTGMGISEIYHHRVFTPFDRLSAETRGIEGTGIGLTLAKKMIELMSGDIGFDSAADKGSTFWIEVNLGTEEKRHQTNTPASNKEINSDVKYSVLYVEDNPANLRLITRILTKDGNIILQDAQNGDIALDILSSDIKFDLILLDIQLPGDINGFDILKEIRDNKKHSGIPIIAISANATEHDIKEGLSAGFNDYITKPINIENFIKIIYHYLS